MQLSQSIRLKQKQSMVMTPRLQQAIRMLQMNNLDLASYLEDQALENPFLEVSANAGEAPGTAADPDAAADATPNDAAPAEAIDTDMKAGASPQDDPGAQQDFDNRFDYSNADGPAGRQTGQRGDQDWDMIAATIAERPPSLFEHVGGQIDMAFDEPKERMIANILLGAVLPSGWLGKPVDDIAEENDLSRDAVARVLTRMQKFEPTGIFATGLADCLRLQAREAGELTASFDILLDNLELLAQGKIDQLARRCKATPDDVRAMLRLIRQFDPKPAETFFRRGGNCQRARSHRLSWPGRMGCRIEQINLAGHHYRRALCSAAKKTCRRTSRTEIYHAGAFFCALAQAGHGTAQ